MYCVWKPTTTLFDILTVARPLCTGYFQALEGQTVVKIRKEDAKLQNDMIDIKIAILHRFNTVFNIIK
jgi:hypothetical protein